MDFSFSKWLIETTMVVPGEPGTRPIPGGHIRLYHYTNPRKAGVSPEQMAEIIRRNGIDIKHAKGSTYGEPNVVWASAELPQRGHIYAEFSVPWNDPRFAIGKPESEQDAQRMAHSGANVAFRDSIRPEEIIAVHEPWHHTYNYLKKNNMITRVLEGEFDYLLDGRHEDEANAIQYIKVNER
jgi:hypothetical protein